MFSRDLSVFLLALSLLSVFLLLVPTAYAILQKLSVFLAIFYLTFYLFNTLKRVFFIKKLSSRNKAILITGCDSGFGHELVKRMDHLGYRVFAFCLNTDGEGALSLKQICSSKVSVLPLDVTSEKSVQEAKKFVEEHLGNDVLWAVVNNAGIGQVGEIDWTSLHDIQRVFDVNTFGTVRVTKAFLPLLRKSNGRIVNTTSSVGRFICPGFITYCMSKSAGIAFTEGIRVELAKWGIQAISIEPFFYKTPLTSSESAVELAQKTWEKSDPETRQAYGEAYFKSFKDSSRFSSVVSSSKISQVISCFEDAITSEEPQSTYFPCYLPHKLGILAFRYLPSYFKESFQRFYLEKSVNLSALPCNGTN